MLVSSFNLSQSFNQAPYLFCKRRFKSEINCFCIRGKGPYCDGCNVKGIVQPFELGSETRLI